MKDFLFLKLLFPFKKLFTLIGVDYQVLRCILQVKLTMDGRRTPTAFNNYRSSQNQNKNRFFISLIMYFIIGLFNLPLILMGNNFMIQMSLVFGIFMFMITMSMISDFSTVMLDIKEKTILVSKPIHPRTINAAKFIHILYYLTCLTLALSLPALIAAGIKFGLTFLMVFMIELILINFLIIFFTSFLYLVILKFFDGEKLKDMINYFQIGLTMVISIGYQFIGQTFQLIEMNFVYHHSWWNFLIPPMWFAAPFELITNQHVETYIIIFSLLALLIPLIGLLTYIKLIPSFEHNLQKLANEASKGKKVKKNHLSYSFSSLLCRSKEERVFYRFASLMMKNEREFKLRVYPSLGFALIFPFIFIFNTNRLNSFEVISKGPSYLFIYFCALMLPISIMSLKFSSNYKAAWVYKSVPLSNLKPIITGSLKAFFVKLILPIFMIESIVFLWFFGVRIWIDLVIVLITILIFMNITYNLLGKALPFSESNADQPKQSGPVFLLMFLLGFFALIHLIITNIDNGPYFYALFLFIVNLLLWKFNYRLSWEDLSYID